MKLIMTLLVRDGEDLIRQNMNFHLSRGVDCIVAIDNGSVDGTREILSKYEEMGLAHVIDEPRRDCAKAEWVTSAATIARDKFGADWILNNDIDEFWWCPNGSLKSRLAATNVDVLICHRMNMLYAFNGDERMPFSRRMVYRVRHPVPVPTLSDIFQDPLPAPYFYLALPPKVLVRAEGLTSIDMGNHSAKFAHRPKTSESDIKVYHFPVRSLDQFRRKITHGGEARERDQELPERTSWHWRRWYRQIQNDRLEQAFSEALPSADRLAKDVAAGTVVEDRTMVRPLEESLGYL